MGGCQWWMGLEQPPQQLSLNRPPHKHLVCEEVPLCVQAAGVDQNVGISGDTRHRARNVIVQPVPAIG